MAINYILKTLCKTFTTLLLWLCLDYFKHFEWGMYFFRLGTTFLGWTKCVDYFMEYLSKRGTSARRNFSWNFHLKIKKKKKMIFVNFRVFFFFYTVKETRLNQFTNLYSASFFDWNDLLLSSVYKMNYTEPIPSRFPPTTAQR